MPTTIAGKYEVLERIGGGGQGTVYRVRHLFLEEIRALKVQADPGQDASDSAARVLREGRALARLRHPHIVQVFDLGRDGNQHYLEMEYVDGPNLAQWLRTTGRPPLREALTIARQIASALAYAHAQAHVDSTGTPRPGMIHRDVKPSNILLRRGVTTHALLADFGLVKLGDGSERTQLGTMMGTYRYSAPEQLGLKRDGKRAVVDQRADLFSLGLVLFELIEGRSFHGALGSEEVVARLVVEHDPLVPRFSLPVDRELSALVAAMVQRHPEDRLAGGMAEVVETLDRVLARLPAEIEQDDETRIDMDRTQLISTVADAHVGRSAAPKPAAERPPTPALRSPAPAPPPPTPAPRAPMPAPPPSPAGSVYTEGPRRRGAPSWLGIGAAALGLAIGVAVLYWIVAERPPPLRFASVDPPGTETLRVPVGEHRRFSITVADAGRHEDLGILWQVDGREAGRGATFDFEPTTTDDGATRKVEVVATAGRGRVSQTWTVTVPTPPTARRVAEVTTTPATVPPATVPPVTAPPPTLLEPSAVPAGPRIAARVPASDRVGIASGDSVQFGLRFPDDVDTQQYRYAWFLDGRPAGSESTFRYRAPQTPSAHGPAQVEVEVTDQQGRTSERVAWRIDQRTAPPRIVETRPANRELRIGAGQPGELFVKAVPGRPDAPLRYEWRIDRMPARITKNGTLAVPDTLTLGKHTIEVIAVDDEDDRRSNAQRFTVIVATAPTSPPPPAPSRTSSPPDSTSASASSGRVTEGEARQWVERLRSAWDRRDRGVLQSLGELPSGKLPRGKVVIGEASIIIDAAGANVWYDRVEDGVSASKRARLVRNADGKLIRR